jgi:hypothetical protein
MQSASRLRISALPRWIAVGACMAFIFYLSSQPSLPWLLDCLRALQSIAGHVIEYAVLAVLLRWALIWDIPSGNGARTGYASRLALLVALAYGVSDELHQHFVPGRTMDPFDLLADAAGAAAALWIAGLVASRRAAATRENEGLPPDLSGQP